MFGRLPAISLRAIRTGNWLAPEAPADLYRLKRCAAVFCVAATLLPVAVAARDARHRPTWPFEISGGQYMPVAWAEIAGWNDDNHLAAFKAFQASCRAVTARRISAVRQKALGASLREPCHAAKTANIMDDAKARAFFETRFRPVRISRLGETDGFVTGYYEPIIEGSRIMTDVYTVPAYRRPSNLFVRGFTQSAPSLPNSGPVYRKIGRRKLVPYYDRAEIEDGAIAGRGLEICWLKSQTDLLFTQIQGSARVRLEDGSTIRINYDSYNGYPYTAVGRILIERNIVPKDQMSMQRIRQWMSENPDGARELRRQNRSYVFFREVKLSDKDEAVGAQGVPLAPGRSIAVDKSLHVYGTPFFIEGELPIESEHAKTPFHRLMIAQDTGSAILGPARADLYFGAGPEAGRVSGRLRHNMHFVMLVPNSLDPVARGRTMPLPETRPSARIAKLFPSKTQKPDDRKAAPQQPASSLAPADQPAGAIPVSAAKAASSEATPLPAARPEVRSGRDRAQRHYHRRHYRHERHHNPR
ncbi:MAG TPA: murein transglycosylase A [Nitrobacter sp.]|nr:murein transglycosylase A [Nitrobacter sp.]